MIEPTATKAAMRARIRADVSILNPQPMMSAKAAKAGRKYRGANIFKGVTRATTKAVTTGRMSQLINNNAVERGIGSSAAAVLRQANDAARRPKRRVLARTLGIKDTRGWA